MATESKADEKKKLNIPLRALISHPPGPRWIGDGTWKRHVASEKLVRDPVFVEDKITIGEEDGNLVLLLLCHGRRLNNQ